MNVHGILRGSFKMKQTSTSVISADYRVFHNTAPPPARLLHTGFIRVFFRLVQQCSVGMIIVHTY
jgi:hypothetical protein